MSVITTTLLITPRDLLNIEDYVWKELLLFENKIFSMEYGFIEKILSVEHINFLKVSHPTGDGSMCFTVQFTATCINPKKNDIMLFTITHNENILVALKHPIYMVIRPSLLTCNIKTNDVVHIKVVATHLNRRQNIIKVLSDIIIIK
jgi:hypothetical protein